jgi:hypothetical protein
MSWQDCMQQHINDTWGPIAAECASAGHDLEAMAACIVKAVGGLNPVTVSAELAGWSVACAFSEDEGAEPTQPEAMP